MFWSYDIGRFCKETSNNYGRFEDAKSDAAKGLAQIVSNNQTLALTDRPVHHVSQDEWLLKMKGLERR